MKKKQRIKEQEQRETEYQCLEEVYGKQIDQVVRCMEEMMGMYRQSGEAAVTAEAADEWRYRYLESRGILAEQYQCIAGILQQIRTRICQSRDVTRQAEADLGKVLRCNRLILEKCMLLDGKNRRKEAILYLHSQDDICIPAASIAGLMREVTDTGWMVSADSRSIVTQETSLVHLEEQPRFFLEHGLARAVKEGERISGDSFSFQGLPDGKWMLALCDGLGAGERANRESRQAVELLEHLLEAGFLPDTALRMLHNTLLMQEQELRPVTMDLAVVDLHTGIGDFYKSGAVTSFVKHETGTELPQPEALPTGYLPVLQPAHHVCRLQDGDYIIMMTDGMLEAVGQADKEEHWKELIGKMHAANPKDMANKLLIYAMAAVDGEPTDDMTVLVSGVWKK